MHRISQTVAKKCHTYPPIILDKSLAKSHYKTCERSELRFLYQRYNLSIFTTFLEENHTTPQDYADLMGLEKRIRLKLTRKGE